LIICQRNVNETERHNPASTELIRRQPALVEPVVIIAGSVGVRGSSPLSLSQLHAEGPGFRGLQPFSGSRPVPLTPASPPNFPPQLGSGRPWASRNDGASGISRARRPSAMVSGRRSPAW